MSDIVNSIIDNKNERPIFTAAYCLNRAQRKYTCTICNELCPDKVFSLKAGEPLKWESCRGCGLCVSACPSACFAPSVSMQNTLTEDLDLNRSVSFSCFEEDTLCDKTVECLAGVPWELLAVLALHTRVYLCTGSCAECDKKERVDVLEQNVAALRDFLGEELYNDRVRLLEKGESVPDEGNESTGEAKTRREVFSDVKSSLTKGLYKITVKKLPFLADTDRDGLQYRKMLANTVLQRRKEAREAEPDKTIPLPTYGLSLPEFNAACWGCEICSRICPHKALEFRDEGSGKKLVYIDTLLCKGCGLCARLCPEHGMNGIRTVHVPYLAKLPLVRVNGASCIKCGSPVRPGDNNGLCPTCLAKSKRKLR